MLQSLLEISDIPNDSQIVEEESFFGSIDFHKLALLDEEYFTTMIVSLCKIVSLAYQYEWLKELTFRKKLRVRDCHYKGKWNMFPCRVSCFTREITNEMIHLVAQSRDKRTLPSKVTDVGEFLFCFCS